MSLSHSDHLSKPNPWNIVQGQVMCFDFPGASGWLIFQPYLAPYFTHRVVHMCVLLIFGIAIARFILVYYCRDGRSTACTGSLSWSAIAHQFLKERNVWFHHLMVTSHPSDGQRAGMSAGTGITFVTMILPRNINKLGKDLAHLTLKRLLLEHISGTCRTIGSTSGNPIRIGLGNRVRSSFSPVEVPCSLMVSVPMSIRCKIWSPEWKMGQFELPLTRGAGLVSSSTYHKHASFIFFCLY